MLKFFNLILITCFIACFSNPALAQAKSNPRCEIWLTFFNLDDNKNKAGFEIISKYVEEQSNLEIVSGSDVGVKRFFNYCIDVVNNEIDKEFNSLKDIVLEPKHTGFVTLKTKTGLELNRM